MTTYVLDKLQEILDFYTGRKDKYDALLDGTSGIALELKQEDIERVEKETELLGKALGYLGEIQDTVSKFYESGYGSLDKKKKRKFDDDIYKLIEIAPDNNMPTIDNCNAIIKNWNSIVERYVLIPTSVALTVVDNDISKVPVAINNPAINYALTKVYNTSKYLLDFCKDYNLTGEELQSAADLTKEYKTNLPAIGKMMKEGACSLEVAKNALIFREEWKQFRDLVDKKNQITLPTIVGVLKLHEGDGLTPEDIVTDLKDRELIGNNEIAEAIKNAKKTRAEIGVGIEDWKEEIGIKQDSDEKDPRE